MPTRTAPIEAYMSLVHEALRVLEQDDIAGCADATPNLTRQILEGAGAFLTEIESIAAAAAGASPDLAIHAGDLRRGAAAIAEVIDWLREAACAKGEALGAAPYGVVNLIGLILVEALWPPMVAAAAEKLATGAGDLQLLARKQILARHGFEREMSAVDVLLRRAKTGADGLMALPADAS